MAQLDEQRAVMLEVVTSTLAGPSLRDVINTGNGERGTGNGERGTGNRERESGNKCTAATLLRI